MKEQRTIVIMPAYNAAKTLERTVSDIPFEYINEIILVDDASRDTTLNLAHSIATSHPNLTLSSEEHRTTGKTLFTSAVS